MIQSWSRDSPSSKKKLRRGVKLSRRDVHSSNHKAGSSMDGEVLDRINREIITEEMTDSLREMIGASVEAEVEITNSNRGKIILSNRGKIILSNRGKSTLSNRGKTSPQR
jgi:hypothetical protein